MMITDEVPSVKATGMPFLGHQDLLLGPALPLSTRRSPKWPCPSEASWDASRMSHLLQSGMADPAAWVPVDC